LARRDARPIVAVRPMSDRLRFGQPPFGSFPRSFVGRLPRPVGCLLALLLCPVLVVAALVTLVLLLFPWGRRRFARFVTPGMASPRPSPREEALLRLVRSFADEESFTAEEARQSGLPVEAGVSVDDLLADALERRWIAVRGERLAVTERGRRALAGVPR
jgi:hypothetical protein